MWDMDWVMVIFFEIEILEGEVGFRGLVEYLYEKE